MKKEKLYQYTGTNGQILSVVFLPDYPNLEFVKLIADEGKVLTRDGKHFFPTVTVAIEDVSKWKEVGQK